MIDERKIRTKIIRYNSKPDIFKMFFFVLLLLFCMCSLYLYSSINEIYCAGNTAQEFT